MNILIRDLLFYAHAFLYYLWHNGFYPAPEQEQASGYMAIYWGCNAYDPDPIGWYNKAYRIRAFDYRVESYHRCVAAPEFP